MADVSRLKQRRTLGAPPPPTEASANLDQPETAPSALSIDGDTKARSVDPQLDRTRPASYDRPDGRSLRRSNRVIQFATRVTPDFDQRIRTIAMREGLLIVEVLERALDAYESKQLAGRQPLAR